MNYLKGFSWMLLMAVLAGCASEKTKSPEFYAPKFTAADMAQLKKRPSKPPFAREEGEDEICEVLIRRFAQDSSSALKSAPGLIFVGLTQSRSDPTATFLKRFGGGKLRVLPASFGTYSPEHMVVEQQTGKRGVLLVIERVDWLDYDHVRVSCTWFAEESKGLEFLYPLTRKSGQWSVR